MSEIFTEKTIDSRLVYTGQILSLKVDTVRLPNQLPSEREVVIHPGGVVIVPIDSDGSFVLVEQFRYPVGEILLEFPAGRLNRGEDPLQAAARELREETGFFGGKLTDLGKIYSAPGFCDEVLHFYLATDLHPGEPEPDQDEFIRTTSLSPVELEKFISTARIKDAKTIVGFHLSRARL